jgi:acyl-coenzyme A thioesterase PaaI-like protein
MPTPADDVFVREWVARRIGWGTDISITLGIEPIAGDLDHVVMSLAFTPEVGQATGIFSAGAIVTLADVTATALCGWVLEQRNQPGFPLCVEIESRLVANSDSRAIATSRIVSDRKRVLRVETLVYDDAERLLATTNTKHIVTTGESIFAAPSP